MDRNPWIKISPHSRQRQFLLLADVREVLYGGAARGGKTCAALMAAAQYLDVPGYSALLLRESFPDLMQPGALIPMSKEWWSDTKADYSVQEKRWTFPSGATITFGYLKHDDDVYQYLGTEYQLVLFDELTAHSEWRYRYLFSRQSKPATGPLSQVPLRMRATSNPGGRGHEWVRKRFIDPRTREPGAVFVPARVSDNPSVDQQAYVSSLSYLDSVTRAQLLEGNWDASGEGRFKREWLRRYQIANLAHGQGGEYVLGTTRYPCGDCWVFQTVDPAASAVSTVKKSDPDWTVIATWAVTPDGKLIWLDCHRFRADIPDIVPQIEQAYAQWRPLFVAIEAVASNRAVLQIAQRSGMVVREVSPRGLDKLVRATPAMILAETGRLWLPDRAHWLEECETELCLAEGAIITTSQGDKPIEQVRAGDMVITRKGWRRVVRAECTNRAATVWQLTSREGRSLQATASHPILVPGCGFIPMSRLRAGHALLRYTAAPVSTVTAADGTTTFPAPSRAGRCSCTATSGNARSAPLVSTSTTRTTTPPTMTLRTWSRYPARTTSTCIAPLSGSRESYRRPVAAVSGRMRLRGETPAPAPCPAATKMPRPGARNTSTVRPVRLAARNFVPREDERSIAACPVPAPTCPTSCDCRPKHAPGAAASSSLLAAPGGFAPFDVVSSVVMLPGKRRVFNLQVDGCHEYVANGLLVHNCLFSGDGRTKDDVVDCLSYASSLMDEYTGGDGARPFLIGGRAY